MISTSNVAMQFSTTPLFENISVKFTDGNRYGLIGANGCGKSTFMKILDNRLQPTSGSVSVTPNERVGVLNQNQFAFDNCRVIDTVIMGHSKLWEIKNERDYLYDLDEMTEEQGMRVAELEVQFAEMDGYSAESRAGDILMSADIEESWHNCLMNQLPLGKKLRVLLIQAIFSEPDILLLDEPTNNLDLNTIRWLEKVLLEQKSTMVVISHDRHFLNTICTHIADIDYEQLKIYPGNYDEFMTASALVREQLLAQNAKKSVQIAELKQFVSRFAANASKAKQATSRARQIEKIKLENIKPSSRVSPFIRFNQSRKLYRRALSFKDLSYQFEEEKTLFSKVSMAIDAGSKIAVIGDNGAGKTTLVRCLVGDLTPKTGQVNLAENASIGYFPQDSSYLFKEDISIFDWMNKWRTDEDDNQIVRAALGQMLFSGEEVKKSVNVCSGGEKARLLFGKLILQKHNILVMDEPTNHLDMESIEALNFALEQYDGTLIFVSHDQQFISSLATDIIEIKTNKICHYCGNYDSYLRNKK